MKDKKNKPLMPKNDITIGCVNSTVPGLTWRFRTEIRIKSKQIEIWITPDLDECDLYLVSKLPNSSTYPEIVKKLVEIEGGLGGDFMNVISCKGAPKPWDELLKMALCNDDDEVRLDEVAFALVDLDYCDIINLHNRYGSLNDDALVTITLEIVDYIKEIKIGSFREALQIANVEEPSNLQSFYEKLEEVADRIYEEHELLYKPFEKLSEKIVNNWEANNPIPSVPSRWLQMGRSGWRQQKSFLIDFIRSYVVEHGENTQIGSSW